MMTRADHPSGSDRIYEALCTLDPHGEADHGGAGFEHERPGRQGDPEPTQQGLEPQSGEHT